MRRPASNRPASDRPVLSWATFLFHFLVLMLSVLMCISCRPSPSTTEQQPQKLYLADPKDLHRSYLDGFDRWTGYRVQINLLAGSYVITREPRGIGWSSRTVDDLPDIVFLCSLPPDNTRPLTIQGTCKGRIPRKPAGPDWYVRVDDCLVTVR